MKSVHKKRLEMLSEIATLKADLAKFKAAETVVKEARIKEAREEVLNRAKAAKNAGDTPENALLTNRFLGLCDQDLRVLNSELARARVDLDKRLRTARFEEGRRQVIDKLRKN